MDNELFKVVLAVAVILTVVLLELIRSHLRNVVKELKQLTSLMTQVRNSIHGVGTIIRSQEQTVEQGESQGATTVLMDEKDRQGSSGRPAL
jgi:hypothetical protein